MRNFISIGQKELNLKYGKLNPVEKSGLSLVSAISALNLNKIFPLLVDNQIEEIYLDSPQSYIYIDHQKYGRCTTLITLNEQEINTLKTFVRISGKQRLDFSHPSIKTTFTNSFFRCRFTMDISPLQQNGFSIDIRKMNKTIFTLPELIQKRTLSNEIAGFLFFCVLNRFNITAIGETSSGKTTLINSLDILVPKHFRRIYIEEVPESLELTKFGIHQLKYQVNLSETTSESSDKTREIYKLLHRNPDIVYLGEILRKKEAHAMFHCLSAGLSGFQTIHAKSIESLINRWKFHFRIDPSCFNDLDILILLKRSITGRYISEISELVCNEDQVSINRFFQFNQRSKCWESNIDILKTKLINNLNLDAERKITIKREMEIYAKIFSSFLTDEQWDITAQIDIFHEVSNHIFQNKIAGKLIKWEFLKPELENWIEGKL